MDFQLPTPVPQEQRTSGLAITSLVLSCLCLGLPGVICGHIALSKIKHSAGQLKGAGLAIAGLVIGYVGMVVVLAFVAMSVLFSGAKAYKTAADRAACVLNQRNVQQAVRTYQGANNLAAGTPIDWEKVVGSQGRMNEPVCPDGGTYTYSPTIPATGVQAVSCSHAHDEKKHVPKDVTGW